MNCVMTCYCLTKKPKDKILLSVLWSVFSLYAPLHIAEGHLKQCSCHPCEAERSLENKMETHNKWDRITVIYNSRGLLQFLDVPLFFRLHKSQRRNMGELAGSEPRSPGSWSRHPADTWKMDALLSSFMHYFGQNISLLYLGQSPFKLHGLKSPQTEPFCIWSSFYAWNQTIFMPWWWTDFFVDEEQRLKLFSSAVQNL